ncbi:XdhC family protein [Dongia sp.]|uniref:XdhC family protein n=1 Tax=Dongia sp. TaxID=1977262 RepID=UPI0034A27A2B
MGTNRPAHPEILDLVAGLKAKGEAFVLATVVRTVSVTAAKAGAKAVIRADGGISDGWIGGGCARAAVLKAAKEALADGQPRRRWPTGSQGWSRSSPGTCSQNMVCVPAKSAMASASPAMPAPAREPWMCLWNRCCPAPPSS